MGRDWTLVVRVVRSREGGNCELGAKERDEREVTRFWSRLDEQVSRGL